MLAHIRSYSDSNAEYGVRSPAVSPLAYKSKAPHTGFEPASPSGPTVFKTAPSPPGHTAIWLVPLLLVGGRLHRGNEDRTHTCGIKIRCASGFLRNPIAPLRGLICHYAIPLFNRRRKIRTLTNGFGDRDAAITPCVYIKSSCF